jgi:hypothetical protein
VSEAHEAASGNQAERTLSPADERIVRGMVEVLLDHEFAPETLARRLGQLFDQLSPELGDFRDDITGHWAEYEVHAASVSDQVFVPAQWDVLCAATSAMLALCRQRLRYDYLAERDADRKLRPSIRLMP